jgi:hypothetical protein
VGVCCCFIAVKSCDNKARVSTPSARSLATSFSRREVLSSSIIDTKESSEGWDSRGEEGVSVHDDAESKLGPVPMPVGRAEKRTMVRRARPRVQSSVGILFCC